jgi:uncharacterized protein YbjT (DUF2867 family)
VFSSPWGENTRIPLIDIQDTGKYLAPVLLNPDIYHGKRLTCATGYLTAPEMVETWSKVTGRAIKLKNLESMKSSSVTTEAQSKENEAFLAFDKYGYFGPTGEEDLFWTLEQVTEKLGTWEEFVRDNEPWFP